LTTFLTTSPAGLGYRALIGEAQHDPAVRELVRGADLLSASARTVLQRVRTGASGVPDDTLAMAQLIGPVLTQILTAQDPFDEHAMRAHAATLLKSWQA
jgi:hypothetical protein